MLIWLTDDNGERFLANPSNITRVEAAGDGSIVHFVDDDYEDVKETPEEIAALCGLVGTLKK